MGTKIHRRCLMFLLFVSPVFGGLSSRSGGEVKLWNTANDQYVPFKAGTNTATLDEIIWGDNSSTSITFSFDVSGTDHTMVAGSGEMTFSNTINADLFRTTLVGGGSKTNVVYGLGGSTPNGTGLFLAGATSFGMAAGEVDVLTATPTVLAIFIDTNLQDNDLDTTGQIVANNNFGVQVDRQGETGSGADVNAAMLVRAGDGGNANLFLSSDSESADNDQGRLTKENGGDLYLATMGSSAWVKGLLMDNTTAFVTIPIGLTVNGLHLNTTTKTDTDYALTAKDDVVLFSTGATTRTASLPAASTVPGKVYHIKKIDSGVGLVTVDPAGSETIDGDLTPDIVAQYESWTISSDGSNWHIH